MSETNSKLSTHHYFQVDTLHEEHTSPRCRMLKKGGPARPQRARRREVRTALRVHRSPFIWVLENGKAPQVIPAYERFFSVRRVFERCEIKAGGLFQHPASSVRSISNATTGTPICHRSRTSGCSSPITPTCFPSDTILPTRPARNEGCWIGSRLYAWFI